MYYVLQYIQEGKFNILRTKYVASLAKILIILKILLIDQNYYITSHYGFF